MLSRYGPYRPVAVVSTAPERFVLLMIWVHWLATRSGSTSLCWSLNNWIWLRRVWSWLTRLALRASVLALVNFGITIAAKMPRMITTIRISTIVKPLLRLRDAHDFV